jgi:raffinose/stachyose/melibiose transport system substrate-binding protein
MRKIFLRGSFYLVLALIVSVFMTACSKTATTSETSTSNAAVSNAPAATASPDAPKAAPVKIKYMTYRVGTQVSAAAEKKIIAEFNKEYGSEVTVEVEEVPDNIAYIDKLKVLAASNDLPDVIEGKNGINDLTIKGNLVTPLNEYVGADPKWKAEIGDGALQANSRDGKIWSIAAGQLLIGYFYNKDIFTKAGIKPADTWDEFFANLDKIKAAGFDPLSLMSGENAWTTNLLLGSIVGTDGDAGNKFLKLLSLLKG